MRMMVMVFGVAKMFGCAMEECRSLHDCPGDMSCNADGACVAMDEQPLARVNAPPPAEDLTDGSWTAPSAIDSEYLGLNVKSTRLVGRVGPELVVDAAPSLIVDEWGTSAYGRGNGATAFVILQPIDQARFKQLLRTPGRTVVDTSAEVYGVTCTLEETWVTHYDEPSSEVIIDVSEPDDDDVVTVEITQESQGGTSVALLMTGTR
jgi:hypothetical protein